MARNKEIPELFEQYMEQFGETEQWITVQEFRTYFQLDELYSHAIAGFLLRITCIRRLDIILLPRYPCKEHQNEDDDRQMIPHRFLMDDPMP